VVFVDWHDVLSRTPYWASIVADRAHPLHGPLRARLGRLYADPALVADWMTGRRSSLEVATWLDLDGGARATPEALCRVLERDCRSMRVNVELLRLLRTTRERAFVVIASDNVDAFAATYRRLTARRERPRPVPDSVPPDSLAAWATSCDDLICSSEVGALKADPGRFFGPYLRACGLYFEDALLIDDRSDNCAAFRDAGGTALRWTMHGDPVEEVLATLAGWLPDPLEPDGEEATATAAGRRPGLLEPRGEEEDGLDADVRDRSGRFDAHQALA
jgi:FMN phosphatase YigB (HAD superfamily)